MQFASAYLVYSDNPFIAIPPRIKAILIIIVCALNGFKPHEIIGIFWKNEMDKCGFP